MIMSIFHITHYNSEDRESFRWTSNELWKCKETTRQSALPLSFQSLLRHLLLLLLLLHRLGTVAAEPSSS